MRQFFIIFLLFVSCNVLGQTLTPQQTKSVDSLFVNWDSPKKPGVAVAIVRNGHEIYSKTFGMADISSGVKINQTTPFWIASVSKQFTAIGISVLERKGALSVNDDISKYLPELDHLPPYSNQASTSSLKWVKGWVYVSRNDAQRRKTL